MIRVEYDSEDLSGHFDCPFCGQSIELAGNVHTYTDENGIERTYPDARLAVNAHFNPDENAHIDDCSAIAKVNDVPWEAVNVATGAVVARGRVTVEIGAHSRGPIAVVEDWPKR